MGVIRSSIGNLEQLRMKTERIKTLKVVGEAVGQLVVEKRTPICAVKIDRIHAELGKFTDHLFKDKVVKQGTIRKEIFFVDPHGELRFTTEEIPFMLTIDIPGFEPDSFTEVQTHLLDINTDFRLIPAVHCRPGCLKQIVVAHILVIVSEWVQLDVVTGVDLSPQISMPNSKSVFCVK